MGIGSLPVHSASSGRALACVVMAVPQAGDGCSRRLGSPRCWGGRGAAPGLQPRYSALRAEPRELAPWYNATRTTLYVIGMLVSAFAFAPAGCSGP